MFELGGEDEIHFYKSYLLHEKCCIYCIPIKELEESGQPPPGQHAGRLPLPEQCYLSPKIYGNLAKLLYLPATCIVILVFMFGIVCSLFSFFFSLFFFRNMPYIILVNINKECVILYL